MARSRFLDQLLLLIAGIAMSIGGYLLISFMDHRGIPARMGFFIGFNLMVAFCVTWQGLVQFRYTWRFWLFYLYWAIVHLLVYGAWGYSGNRIELCGFSIPFEAYWFFRIATSRFRPNLEDRSPSL